MGHTVKIIALGCAKNICDAQGMAGSLLQSGWRVTDRLSRADAVIVHTCSFIKPAREESFREIARTLAKVKLGQVVVTGCWVQESATMLAHQFPQVKAFLGTGELHRISDVLTVPGRSLILRSKPGGWLDWEGRKHLTPAGGSAYLRISEGCSHRCTFCSIPRLRGSFRSRQLHDITDEVSALAKHNVKELNIIGQDTTAYGADLSKKIGLAGVLSHICRHESFRFIRIMYTYPTGITGRLLSMMRDEKAICRYLDMPLQHVSSAVLKRMGRPHNEKTTRALVEKIVRHVPGIALRTTFITGFPGETEKDFLTLLNFVKEGFFTHAGVFSYSKEQNTPAARFVPVIPERLREERKKRLIAAQKKVIREKNKNRSGRIYEVLITAKDGIYGAGRSEYEAPDVDGKIFFSGSLMKRKAVGDLCRVRITGIDTYDCFGKIIS